MRDTYLDKAKRLMFEIFENDESEYASKVHFWKQVNIWPILQSFYFVKSEPELAQLPSFEQTFLPGPSKYWCFLGDT